MPIAAYLRRLPSPQPSICRSRLFSTRDTNDASWPHQIHISSRVVDRKSLFLAHASILHVPDDLPRLLEHLRPTLKRAPTHCMYAWRAGTQAGQSDGGEGGSGDRLARLIAHANSDVVVIVWRWYGGVKLGPDRWKRISEAAKEALDYGAFLAKSEQEKTTKTKNKK